MGSRVQLFSQARRGRRSKVAGHREGFLSIRPQCAYGAVAIPKKDAPSIVPAYGRKADVEFIENGSDPGARLRKRHRFKHALIQDAAYENLLSKEMKQLLAMDRYERRALSRREFAIRAFDEARRRHYDCD